MTIEELQALLKTVLEQTQKAQVDLANVIRQAEHAGEMLDNIYTAIIEACETDDDDDE